MTLKNPWVAVVWGLALSSAWGGTPSADDEAWHFMGEKAKQGAEWYYLDSSPQDGESINVFMLGPNPFDPRLIRHFMTDPSGHVGIRVQISFKDGERVDVDYRLHGEQNLRATQAPFELAIGKTTLKRTNPGAALPAYEIALDATDNKTGTHVTGLITYRAINPPWMFGDGYIFKGKNRFARWVTPSTRTEVTGHYTVTFKDGRKREATVKSTGYIEHVWANISFPLILKGWYWGRGYSGDKTYLFVKFLPQANLYGFKGLNVMHVADSRGSLFETSSASFDLHEESLGSTRFDNGVAYPNLLSALGFDPLTNKTMRFEYLQRGPITDSEPYFVRTQGALVTYECEGQTSDCSDRQTGMTGAIGDHVDSNKMMRYLLKKAF